MNQETLNNIKDLMAKNGSIELLAAYVMRELETTDVEYAIDIAYCIMNTVDALIDKNREYEFDEDESEEDCDD